MGNILETQIKVFNTSFVVPGKAKRHESYDLKVKLDGYLLTTDDDEDEQACITRTIAELEFEESTPASACLKHDGDDDDLVRPFHITREVPCQRIGTNMLSRAEVSATLMTDGAVFSDAISAISLYKVRFQFSRCGEEGETDTPAEPDEGVPEEQPGATPDEEPGEAPETEPDENPDDVHGVEPM